MAKRGGGGRQQNQPKQGASPAPAKPAVVVSVPPATQSKIDEILNESPATATAEETTIQLDGDSNESAAVEALNDPKTLELMLEAEEKKEKAPELSQHSKFEKFKNQNKKENR